MRPDPPPTFGLSGRVFACMILLYPPEFRRQFASEMRSVFEAELHDAWHARHLVGLTEIWLLALRELLTVALPMQLQSTPVVASAASLVGTPVLYLFLLWALEDKTDAIAYAHRLRH